MQLIDTHCHIQFPDYGLDPDEVREAATEVGVTRLLCVGCTLKDSQAAIAFAKDRESVWATIGLHPHEASLCVHDHHALQQFRNLASHPKVVAVGETGLDYYYEHSPRQLQAQLLRFQIDVAQEHNLPLIFHVREAFADFWQIFDEYNELRGVVHSFSATQKELDEVLTRGLYVGLNGIMTFTKDKQQLEAAKKVPLNRLVLETDAPFLTPAPFRGKICEPKHVRVTAEFLANLRGESLEELAMATTQSAQSLFGIN
jgi:TatD DNase family protein